MAVCALQAMADAEAGKKICRCLAVCMQGGPDASPAVTVAERPPEALAAPAHLLALLLHDLAGSGSALDDPVIVDSALPMVFRVAP